MAAASVDVAAEEVTIKLWSRADRSGPLRAGNIVAATEPLNAALKAAGSDTTVKVEVFEGPATGYDQDALDLLKAFRFSAGAHVYVAAHEWVGEFANSGYAMNLEDFVVANPWAFGDVIPVLWKSTKHEGQISCHPGGFRNPHVHVQQGHAAQDRQGRGVHRGPADLVEKGEFTMTDLSNGEGGGRSGCGPVASCTGPIPVPTIS